MPVPETIACPPCDSTVSRSKGAIGIVDAVTRAIDGRENQTFHWLQEKEIEDGDEDKDEDDHEAEEEAQWCRAFITHADTCSSAHGTGWASTIHSHRLHAAWCQLPLLRVHTVHALKAGARCLSDRGQERVQKQEFILKASYMDVLLSFHQPTRRATARTVIREM